MSLRWLKRSGGTPRKTLLAQERLHYFTFQAYGQSSQDLRQLTTNNPSILATLKRLESCPDSMPMALCLELDVPEDACYGAGVVQWRHRLTNDVPSRFSATRTSHAAWDFRAAFNEIVADPPQAPDGRLHYFAKVETEDGICILEMLLGQLWSCGDIMTGSLCRRLGLPAQSTYAKGARYLRDTNDLDHLFSAQKRGA